MVDAQQDDLLPDQVNPFNSGSTTPTPPPPPEARSTDEEVERSIAQRSTDITLPIYPYGDEARDRFLFDPGSCSTQDMDAVFRRAECDLGPKSRLDDDDFEVFQRAVEHLIPWIRDDHDAHASDAVWAWIVCVCGGAGYLRHRELASGLRDSFPLCPMDPGATHNEWRKSLVGAHSLCGWPATIAHLDYASLVPLYGDEEGPLPPPAWARVVACFHYVKHARIGEGDKGAHVAIQYHSGTAAGPTRIATLAAEEPNAAARGKILRALGARPPSKQKEDSWPHMALKQTVTRTPPDRLLAVRPVADLDPHYLPAPCARVVPSVTTRRTFVRTGRGMDGVWRATTSGRLIPDSGGHRLSLSTDWPAPSGAVDEFARLLPSTFPTDCLPAAQLRQAFPNIDIPTSNPLSWEAIVSAALMSGLMRRFDSERPVMAAVPASSKEIEDSTNTGKTTAIVALARVWAPSLRRASVVGTGAPAQRSALDSISRYGTVPLDEFNLSNAEGSLFSEASILAMATGNEMDIGRVLSNTKNAAVLRAPLPVSSKVWSARDDMFSRTIPIPLRPLSSSERAANGFDAVQSGAWSIACRMSCLYFIDKWNLQELVDKARPSGGAFRFNRLRYLSALLYSAVAREPVRASLKEIDRAARAMHAWQDRRLREAVESGTLANARATGKVVFGLDACLNELRPEQFDHLEAASMKNALAPKDFLREIARSEGSNASLGSMFDAITGHSSTKDRQAIYAVAREIRSVLPNVGDTHRLPGYAGLVEGRRVRRVKDRARQVQIVFDPPGSAKTPAPTPTTPDAPTPFDVPDTPTPSKETDHGTDTGQDPDISRHRDGVHAATVAETDVATSLPLPFVDDGDGGPSGEWER